MLTSPLWLHYRNPLAAPAKTYMPAIKISRSPRDRNDFWRRKHGSTKLSHLSEFLLFIFLLNETLYGSPCAGKAKGLARKKKKAFQLNFITFTTFRSGKKCPKSNKKGIKIKSRH